MLKLTVLFLVVAVVLAVLSFGDLVGVAASLVRLLFWAASGGAVLSFVLGIFLYRRAT